MCSVCVHVHRSPLSLWNHESCDSKHDPGALCEVGICSKAARNTHELFSPSKFCQKLSLWIRWSSCLYCHRKEPLWIWVSVLHGPVFPKPAWTVCKSILCLQIDKISSVSICPGAQRATLYLVGTSERNQLYISFYLCSKYFSRKATDSDSFWTVSEKLPMSKSWHFTCTVRLTVAL